MQFRDRRPLTIKKSYGIICAKMNDKTNKLEFILVHKRLSFSFIDFILHSKSGMDDSRIMYLLNTMTNEEKIDLLSLDIDRIWYRLWLAYNDKENHTEKYEHCKQIFEHNFLMDGGKRLRDLVARSTRSESLWEIPKGRKNTSQEKDLNAAIREFEEETSINPGDYILFQEQPLKHVFVHGYTKYISYYYLAYCPDNLKIKYHLNLSNLQQAGEIINIKWLDIDQIKILDSYNRLTPLIKIASKILRKKYHVGKMHNLNLFD